MVCAMCGEYLLPPLSKVRAVCGSTACTDLRGGRRVIGVPTATTDALCSIIPHEIMTLTIRVNRFKREAEVLASLNHPNVANIYDLQADQISPRHCQLRLSTHVRMLCAVADFRIASHGFESPVSSELRRKPWVAVPRP